MGRSNYSFQKRQKELARKQKKAEKLKRKLTKNTGGSEETPDASQDETKDETGAAEPLESG